MDVFDLIDIQHSKYSRPTNQKLRKWNQEQFFSVAKHLELYVKKSEIYSFFNSTDHKASYMYEGCPILWQIYT